jgi:CHAD domain-containing protein
MHKALLKQTRKIEKAAASLRQAYDVEELHDLRVAIRRIRSLLKGRGKQRLRRYRRTWGAFARVSNRARDWDVFLEQAGELLDSAANRRFRSSCRSAVRASRDSVIKMLNSPHWSAHLEEWKAHLERRAQPHPAPGVSRNDLPRSDRLAATIDKANAVLALAPDDSNEDAWHRLRIAVKEARYQAERMREQESGPDSRTVISTCKKLQTSLGAWHDCVVQLRLLDELKRKSPDAAALASELRPKLEQLRAKQLARARERLAQQSVFECAARSDAGTEPSRAGVRVVR